MATNLNILFSYKKIVPIKYREIDITTLKNNPIIHKDDWIETHFSSIKRYFRYNQYKNQKRRCSYCRRLLNPLGINEHIDHIVPRSFKKGWMFKPRNLVLSCYQCNTQKKELISINSQDSCRRLPKKAENYIIFNPYFHNWGAHFEIEDNLFIKAKSFIGEKTIKELKLFDYKYSIKYAEEAKIFGDSAIKRATKRINKYPQNSIEYLSAKKLITEIERHI